MELARRIVRRYVPQRHRAKLRRLRHALPLLGPTYRCSCCGWPSRRLLTVKDRPNAKCPWCGSLERHRLLAFYLRKRTPVFERATDVLHIAPEEGISRVLRGSKARTLTIDLASPLAERHEDVRALTLPDAAYDLVICSHVLEHVQEDRQAMSELYRVLRPGGTLIVMVPYDGTAERTREDPAVVDPADRLRLFGQHDHVRYYGRDLLDRLRSVGFDVEEDHYGRSLPPAVARKYAVGRSPIFRCDKPVDAGAATADRP